VTERLFKYHGLGNDFVILDRRKSGEDISADVARQLCERRRGVGADGVLVLLPAEGAWARMVVHNADGSVPEMCGNGLRCAVKYLVDHSDQKPERIPILTGAGLLSCDVQYVEGLAEEVVVSMGPARLVASNLPSAKSGPFVHQEVPGFPGVRGTAVSMGNPHLVLFDSPLERAPTLGPQLETAEGFPERTNVEFAQVEGSGVTLVVWERGVGLTQACGTGACATVAAAVEEGRLPASEWIRVRLPGGALGIRADKDLSNVLMRGPATFVFEAAVPAL
jgi:diaminopimelate epimerase